MHTLEVSDDSVEVVFVSNGETVRLYTFGRSRIRVAQALVNYLNGGTGGELFWEIQPEEVVVH